MNLPNKITISRIILSFIIIFLLLFPFDAAGINVPKLFINESIVVDVTYLIGAVLFIIASLTDCIDGYIARKRGLVTDFGKMIDAIADKILVNPILIILAAKGFISPIIPVIIVARDSFVNSIKMVASSKGNVVSAIKLGKLKTICLMVGIVLTLLYNLPFELYNLRVADALLIVSCVLAIISAIEYYNMNKKFIFSEKTEKIEVE